MSRPSAPSRLIVLLLSAVLMTAAASAFAASAAQAAVPFRGVQVHSLWSSSSDSDMQRELDLAAGAHANVIRVDVMWASLESDGKGQYSSWYLKKLDQFVQGAQARGMRVIATLWGSPCWASTAPENIKQGCRGAYWDRGVNAYPPANVADYGDAARFVTARYGTKLAALEVWNEPNLDNSYFWKAADKAGEYARLLRAAYRPAKAGNPNVPVLGGALAFNDRPFLDALESKGIKGYHDGISVHPYNESRAPADRWKPEWSKYSLVPGLESLHAGLRRAGDKQDLWVTEFGWTTGTKSGWRVSEATQARYVADSFSVLGALPFVKSAVVYNLRDKSADRSSHEDNFGLVHRDFSPKPAYAALRSALSGGAVAASRRASLSLGVRRHGRFSVAFGRAPGGSRITMRLSGCSAGRRALVVRASGRGAFTRKLGQRRRLRGCRVTASVAGSVRTARLGKRARDSLRAAGVLRLLAC